MRCLLVLVLAACSGPPVVEPTPAVAPAAVSAPPDAMKPASPTIIWAPTVRALTEAEQAAMIGVSWHEGCPVALTELAIVELAHHRPDGTPARGELIVHSDVADDVVAVFARLWEARFPLTSVRPVQHFDGDDGRSMAADNTSGFNCRPVGRSKTWSEHAYGRAIDVNPVRNPYLRGERVDPEAGRDWLDRDASRPGVIVSGGVVVEAFASIGWRWGGHWTRSKDYQHFSKSGR